MKVLKIDRKSNEIICVPQIHEDLWHLEKIIEKGDIVFGVTDRKIKPKFEGEKTERVKIFVEVEVMDVHFGEYSEELRINGVILSGKPEALVELKSHQTIEVKIGDRIKIRKKSIKQWQVERLRKAENFSNEMSFLVVLLDDEVCDLAFLTQYSINKKATIREKKRGKRFETGESSYFDEILQKIKLLSPKKILISGPGFTKDNLKKFIIEKKIIEPARALTESTNSVGETGFKELISQGKLEKIENQIQLSRESKVIEEFLAMLAKGRAEYGVEKVVEAISLGAVEKLILSETYLMQNRTEAEKVLELAESMGAEVNIVSSKNPQEKQIHSFGGVVATLRYTLG